MNETNAPPAVRLSDNPCPHTASCELFPLFRSKGAAGLFKMHYCQAEYRDCARYKLAVAGRTIPRSLLPDGSLLRPK